MNAGQRRFAGLPFAVTPEIEGALAAGAVCATSVSGGKDSGATALAVGTYLDAIGHPRRDRLIVHADLGRAEWPSTAGFVERIAAHLGTELMVVRRGAGDLVARWQNRFENGKRRYAALETMRLVSPWSSPQNRFCTSEMKGDVIGPAMARRFAGRTVIQAVGIRRDESRRRAATSVMRPDVRSAPPGNRRGTRILLWHPLVEATSEEVFAAHAAEGLPLHEAYAEHGSTRLSCAFCIMSSAPDMAAAAGSPQNIPLYRELTRMEVESAFSFQASRWLADVAPELMDPAVATCLPEAKAAAADRRTAEASLPDLGPPASWPSRTPSMEEAWLMAEVRAPILRRAGLPDLYPTGPAVAQRLADLHGSRKRHPG